MSTAGAMDGLFASLIDDASLFPPASLPMPIAVGEHRRHRNSGYTEVVNRFLCPASRLQELRSDLADGDRFDVGIILDTGVHGFRTVLKQSAADPRLKLTVLDMPVPSGTSAEQIDQVRSQVKDVKVELVDDRVRAYVVFDMHGKDVTLQLEGKLGAQDGYLNFEPVSGSIGSLPLPPSALQSAMRHILENPENREKFKLPSDMSDLKIVNGEVVATYK